MSSSPRQAAGERWVIVTERHDGTLSFAHPGCERDAWRAYSNLWRSAPSGVKRIELRCSDSSGTRVVAGKEGRWDL